MIERTFLVTGATKGIGRALSDRLQAAGHHVVGIARGQDPTFPGTLVPIDLNDSKISGEAFTELTQRYSFDGVVNNAGLSRPDRIGEVDLKDLDDIMRINVHSAVQAVQAILPGMRAKRWGRIVNISSLAVLGGIVHRTAYAAAKAAISSMTRSWALELAESGITVNAVAPGPIETELFRRNTPVGSEAERRFLSLVPMRRFGKPEEIAATIAFLLSDEAGLMTGQTLYVDGGASIGKSLG
jgi:NAD(P)-dependent dehydrogenase (short-subunit alcohol dehydrogenase family)